MPAGRPTKYDPEVHVQSLIEHYMQGHGYAHFCAEHWIGKSTFYRWVEQHEEFRDAFEIAKMQAMMWWEEQGMDGLTCKEGFNATLYKFFMANKFGWVGENKQTKVEHSLEEGSKDDDKLVIEVSKKPKV